MPHTCNSPLIIKNLEELLPSDELCPVICDYGVRNSEAVHDVQEESHVLFGRDCSQGLSLDPFGELVDNDKCVYPPGSLWSGPTRSSPHITNDHMMGYCLQRLHRQVGPSRVELTTLLGVCDHSWPIEPLSENVPTKDLGAAWCPQMPPWMSSTSCFPCLVGMQLLQEPCATSLIQLLYDHNEGLGQTCQTPSVGFIREEYAVEEVSEEGLRPVC